MFYTLKHTNIGDESYSFETTAPPFSKKREGRLAKVACTNCRISKLKCSADPNGCQRCLHKKIKCQYPSAPKSCAQKKASSTKARHSRARSVATVETTSSAASSTSGDDLPATTPNKEPTFESNPQELGLFFDMADFIAPDSASTLLSDEFMDMDQLDVMLPWQQQPFNFTPNTNKAPWNDMPELEDIDFSSSNTNSSSVTRLPTPEPNCSCFVQAVSTNEAVEVARWGLKELSGDVDEILQQLNKALLECEELLECQKCSVQPSYVMLLLNMCSKMLASIEDISIGTSMLGSDRSQSSEYRKRRRCASDGAERNDNRSREVGTSLRSWQLDDDDEHLVLQSLIRARVAKLERLLSILNKVVSENSWPAHSGMMRDLQTRLLRGSFGISVISNPSWSAPSLSQTLFSE